MNTISNILKQSKLSVTANRQKILQLFFENNGALAHADIEKKNGKDIDRVTVYRTLQSFVEKGIIHTIPTSDNSIKYALCKDECEEGHHHDHHIHLVCNICHITFCLDNVVTPEIKLPQGYTMIQADVVVKGICKNCNKPGNQPLN